MDKQHILSLPTSGAEAKNECGQRCVGNLKISRRLPAVKVMELAKLIQ